MYVKWIELAARGMTRERTKEEEDERQKDRLGALAGMLFFLALMMFHKWHNP